MITDKEELEERRHQIMRLLMHANLRLSQYVDEYRRPYVIGDRVDDSCAYNTAEAARQVSIHSIQLTAINDIIKEQL